MTKIGLFFVLNSICGMTLSAQSPLAISVPAGDPIQYTFSLANQLQSTGTSITTATVDATGNVYFAGSTAVPLPATRGAFKNVFAACSPIPSSMTNPIGRPACSWAFAAKLSAEGTLLWLTYVPEPNGNSVIGKIAVDGTGSVYLAGGYETVDKLPSAFPVTPGAFETTPQGKSGSFVAKLNSAGSKLIWATYFNNIGYVKAIYPNSNGDLYLGIQTEALVDLPLVNPLPGMAPSVESGYLAKLNAAGSGLLFATWVNAPGARSGINAITLDGAGDLYVTGGCFYESPAADPCVPTTAGAFQRSMKSSSTIYAMKLKPDGTLVYSTLLGGGGSQGAFGMAVDAEGNIVLAGKVNAAGPQLPFDFPVTDGAFQTKNPKFTRTTPSTGFVAKLDTSGSMLLYSTYFGGSSEDSITGFALDSRANLIFGGYSYSPDLPVTPDAWQPCHPAPDFDNPDGVKASFVGRLTADGRSLSYGSFVGPGGTLPSGNVGSSFTLFGLDATGDLYLLGSESGFPAIVRYRMTPRPQGSAACVASVTHGYESAVSPLGLVRIRGNGIAGSRSLSPTFAAGESLPSSYQGLKVFFDQTPAPLLAIEANQITVVAPLVLFVNDAPPISTSIRIVQDEVVTAELRSSVQSVTPGVLTADGSGLGSAAAVNQDGSVNSHDKPAVPGSVISIYLTGLGLTNPQLEPGTVAAVPGSVQARVEAVLWTSTAQVLYAGPAPGLLAGVYQVNFRVPRTGIADWVPLAIKAGDHAVRSQSGNAEVGIYVSCPGGSTCVQLR